jgi:2-keto-4-pentenoate hydratase/2-oxohepta-3-ene-1,7-dioic acid hydratase in catechol pathway
MKIVRYRTEEEESTYGWVQDDKVGAILGSPFDFYRRLETITSIQRTSLLPPLLPGKIIAIRDNYVHHGIEDQAIPEIPIFFLKPTQSITGTKKAIIIPSQTIELVAQAELAVVIGKQGRWIPLDQAYNHIFGYTCAATFFARDMAILDGYAQYRAYYFDTFTSLGPWIETELDPNDIVISTSNNKSLVHLTTTHEMLFSVPQLVAYLSSIMTLMPGDVILTGPTHPGIRVAPNDFLQIEIDGIGILENTVTPEVRPRSI